MFAALTQPRAYSGHQIDPLESEEELTLTLEKFATIARVKYVESGRIILSKFEETNGSYQSLIQQASSLAGVSAGARGSVDIKEQLLVVEMQLTWMVYIMSACIGAREVCLRLISAKRKLRSKSDNEYERFFFLENCLL